MAANRFECRSALLAAVLIGAFCLCSVPLTVRVWHLIDFPWVLLQFSDANERGETGA